MGALLPRDFLERQPKRWQKSQRKRRVLGTLRKIKAKREKLEQKVYEQAQRDAGIDLHYDTKRAAKEPPSKAVKAAPAAQESPPPLSSRSTPIGLRARGLWAAELAPYQPLVVRIPEGVQIVLQRASLKEVDRSAAAETMVRCRTPATKLPTTLCLLQPGKEETCGLSALFTEADRSCAIAVEGPDVVHIFGRYTRPGGAMHAAAPELAPPLPTAPAKRKADAAQPLPGPQPKAPSAAPSPAAAPSAPTLVELAEGLKYTDVKPGKGRQAVRGNKLAVKYVGLAPDARAAGGWKEFDSNGGKQLHFTLGEGEVIRGWDAGLAGMRVGGTRRLVIPPAMGYGERGAGPVPPRATLIFEINLLNVS